MNETTTVVMLGAGMSGICMAIKLREAGVEDLVILEKSAGPGGTWNDNTYPGACCDVASHLYSFSFEPNPNWSRAYSEQAEIRTYFEHCVDKYGLRSLIRYGTTVVSAHYQEDTGHWLVGTAAGESLRCKFLVSGLGQLNLPNTPEFEGQESFSGESFHSARWNHDMDLKGKRVAVIGNAASAIQFIPPVAEQAEQVVVYQRSANYLVPRNDFSYSPAAKQRFADHPWLQKLSRLRWFMRQELIMIGAMLSGSLRQKLMTWMSTKYLQEQVSDPQLQSKLSPDYPMGCKRILVSDDYYQALVQHGVELVTSPIEGIGPEGVRTQGGIERSVDVIIYGTGFRATEFLAELDVRGRDGMALKDSWADGAQALRGVAVPGYPNLFLLYGPNTNLGHNSIIFMVEAQVKYIVQCIDKVLAHDLKALEANQAASTSFNQHLQADLEKTVWGGECGSWYKNYSGKITNNWPHTAARFALSMRTPDFTEYNMSV